MDQSATRAAILRDSGAPEMLGYGDLPTPVPGPGEIVVRVLAAQPSRLDHYLREDSVTRELKLPTCSARTRPGLSRR
jgi:NADPH:quinone reductase-like Zn-dependent oxidoreductase